MSEWRQATLGEVLSLEYGKALSERNRDGEGFPVLGSNGPVGKHSAPLVRGPGIVVGRKGTAGSVTWVDSHFYPIDTTYFVRLRDSGAVSMEFANLLLLHADLPSVCAQTGVPGLNRDRAYDIPTSLPPLAEQRRIVDVVAAVDGQIQALEAEAEAARVVLMRRRDLVVNNHDFRLATGEQAFSILMGRQRSPQRANGPHMTYYLRSANVSAGHLILDDVKQMDFDPTERVKFGLAPGDVLVSEGSASASAVGMAAVWSGEIDGPVCFQNTLLRYRARPGVTTTDFVNHWCKWAYESGAFREAASGTNIKHIGSTRATAMPVFVPPLDLQAPLMAELNALEENAQSLGTELDAVRAFRSALLNALLSQAIAIPESYDSFRDRAAAA